MSNTKARSIIAFFLLSCAMDTYALDWVGVDLQGRACEGRGQGFGPYDYFDIDEETDKLYVQGRLWEIDKVHTDRAVPVLNQKGPIQQGDFQYAMGNLDYTLRAIPNEPRALQYIIEIDQIWRASKGRLINRYPPPECYFQRAISFRPAQEHLRLLFGIYLNRLGRYDQEAEQYAAAVKINEFSAEGHYNLGLALIKLDRYEEAAVHAKVAYELGFPLQGLRKKLNAKGITLAE